LIAKHLRTENEDVAHEPLPERSVELIQHLNELERARERVQQSERD